MARARAIRRCAAALAALAALALVPSQAFAAGIYTCVDANGTRHTSDRPIPECATREQRVLNADGSTRNVIAPALTAAERAAKEAREREQAAEQAARVDAMRGDRYLMLRYPDEAAHRRAREAALSTVRQASELSQRRMVELAAERKAALAEAEFYKDSRMPLKLKQQLDANEAATASQRQLIEGHEAEAQRINARYDAELTRLRRLWAGAAPGSLGPLHSTTAASAAAGR